MTATKKTARTDFKLGEDIVYPAHGVGKIMRLENQEVAGAELELYVVAFEKDKMTLRVPVPKAKAVGMRRLASDETVDRSLEIVRGRARIKRTMWSRRAQEYEAKINSGDLLSIAEVVRDLFRSEAQPEQSYSERQLYEAALDRMSREIAAVTGLSETEAVQRVEQKSCQEPASRGQDRRRRGASRVVHALVGYDLDAGARRQQSAGLQSIQDDQQLRRVDDAAHLCRQTSHGVIGADGDDSDPQWPEVRCFQRC